MSVKMSENLWGGPFWNHTVETIEKFTQKYLYRILNSFRSRSVNAVDEWEVPRDARVLATSISTAPNVAFTTNNGY